MLLLSLLFSPILGVVAVFINKEKKGSLIRTKIIAISAAILCFFISLVLFISFDFSTNQFQLVQECYAISYFDFYLGIDGLSIYFVLLTTIIIPISLLSNWKSIDKEVESYLAIILLLESLLLAVFLVLDILLFYIFFESILPPLFLLIGIFGSDNRVKASFYLFLYTLLGSLFLLLSILTMSSVMSTTDYDTLFKANFIFITQLFLFYGIFIAFAVKTPTIFLNTWLLKAHVESPLGGSIILAAIVLKLSLYGILRLILPILPKAYTEYTYIIFLIGVITIIYASLSTLRTIDVKELIAYSSVSHAAVYLLGVFSNGIQAIEGAITLGLAHGFVSPGLFICTGGVLYDRAHTRVMTFYRGVTQVMPLFVILFFILCLANCGAPLTLNFIGEFLSLYGVFERSSLYGLFASSSIIFSAAYTIYMFQRISFGGAYSRMFTVVMSDLTKREFTILMILVVPVVALGIYPAFILDGLSYGVSTLLYNSDTIVDLVNSKEFFSATMTLSTNNQPRITQGELADYVEGKGNTGNKDIDECPNSQTNEHKLAETRPADVTEGDAVTENCLNCEKFMETAKETYLSCINCGESFCSGCFREVFYGNASESMAFFITIESPVLTMLSLLHRLYKLGYFSIFRVILLSVAVGMFAVYPDLSLGGLHYAISVLFYNSDILAGLSSVPFTTEQKYIIEKADDFDRTTLSNTSTVTSLREKSNDNVEVLKSMVEAEAEKIKATQQEIAEGLKTAMQQNPQNADHFEEKLYTTEDTSTQAVSELKSAAEVAVDQINDGQPLSEEFLLVVVDVAGVELVSSFLVVFSVLLQIYLNKNYRHCISVLLHSLKW